MSEQPSTATTEVIFPGRVELELRQSNGVFEGFGAVRAAGVPLRDGAEPIRFELTTPDGVELIHPRLCEQHREQACHRFVFTLERREGGPMEYMLHSVRPRRNLRRFRPPRPAPEARLELELRPAHRELGAFSADGFSYRWRYLNPPDPIFRITEYGSWEPGGSALGCEFRLRNCFVPSLVEFHSPEDFYSSEWYLPGCRNPNIFQFLPFQTELQGFTFTSGAAGTVLSWSPQVTHLRSLFEKERGENRIRHYHEFCGDLAADFQTPAFEILFVPGALALHQRDNLYEAMKELVHETLHAELGLRRERVSSYGVVEEWTNADLRRYAAEAVPALAACGVRKIFTPSHFENNMNVWGVSNMCCTVDYRVAPGVGEESFKVLCAACHRYGIKLEMWANTSISTLSWIFDQRNGRPGRINFLPREGSIMEALDQATDPFVRNPSNALEADHYTPVFAVLNLRDPAVRDYWLRQWGYAARELGLDGFFLDSSFNLSSDKFHWIQNAGSTSPGGATADQTALLGFFRPAQPPPAAILSQYRAHLELMREMQRLGYDYCTEDLGVFGTHRHGPGIELRLNCLPLWSECYAQFEPEKIIAAGDDPARVFFEGLACRLMWTLFWDPATGTVGFHQPEAGKPAAPCPPDPEQLALLAAFNLAEPEMRGPREILPERSAVVYHGEHATVVWACRDLDWPLPPGTRLVELPSLHEVTPPLRARRVYRIG